MSSAVYQHRLAHIPSQKQVTGLMETLTSFSRPTLHLAHGAKMTNNWSDNWSELSWEPVAVTQRLRSKRVESPQHFSSATGASHLHYCEGEEGNSWPEEKHF